MVSRRASTADVDRVGEGERDLVQLGDAVGLVGRAARHRHRQQRHQARAAPLGREGDGLQRLPGLGRAELQRARARAIARRRARPAAW